MHLPLCTCPGEGWTELHACFAFLPIEREAADQEEKVRSENQYERARREALERLKQEEQRRKREEEKQAEILREQMAELQLRDVEVREGRIP